MVRPCGLTSRYGPELDKKVITKFEMKVRSMKKGGTPTGTHIGTKKKHPSSEE